MIRAFTPAPSQAQQDTNSDLQTDAKTVNPTVRSGSSSSENAPIYSSPHFHLLPSTHFHYHNNSTAPAPTSAPKLSLVPHEIVQDSATAQQYTPTTQIKWPLDNNDSADYQQHDTAAIESRESEKEEILPAAESEESKSREEGREKSQRSAHQISTSTTRRSKRERVEQDSCITPERVRVRLTPLKERFLREVRMSSQERVQTQVAFGTPKRDGRRGSPVKEENAKKGSKAVDTGKENDGGAGRMSPTKNHLEVGQNGFYYSCEIPMSKVVGKKDAGVGGDVDGTPHKKMEKNGTPKKNGIDTPKKDNTNTSNMPNFATSPAKLRGPGTPIRHRMPHLVDSAKKTDSSKKTKNSTPGSRNIGDMMAGLNFRKDVSGSSPMVHAVEGKVSAPPTPLRRAAERSGISSSAQGMLKKLQDGDRSKAIKPEQHDGVENVASPLQQKQSHAIAVALPTPQTDTTNDIGIAPLSISPIKHSSRRILKRVGTDPAVLLAMKDDMVRMETRMGRSLSASSGIPTINKTTSSTPPVIINPPSNSHVEQTVPSRSVPKLVTTPHKPSTPQTKTIPLHHQALRLQNSTPKLTPRQPLRTSCTHLRTPPPRPRNPTPLSTPARNRREAAKVSTLVTRPNLSTPKAIKTPTSIPAYMRPTLASSAAVQSSPNPKTVTTPKTLNTPKTPKSFSKPTATPTKVPTTLPKPRTSGTDSAPPKKNFVGATEISARVTKWHNEEREKDAIDSPLTIRVEKAPRKNMARYTRDGQKVKAVKSPLKNDEIIAEGQEVKKSNTPIGSPRRAAEELIEHTSLASGIAPLFPSPPSNHRDHVQPKGPKKHTTPRTPLPSKQTSKIARMDRNAFRTPSKEIEKSLDEAIDRKIEEERRVGAW